MAAQKHREQMEAQRRKVLQEVRAKELEKRTQMEERRKALELADRERREALRKKNLVRQNSLIGKHAFRHCLRDQQRSLPSCICP